MLYDSGNFDQVCWNFILHFRETSSKHKENTLNERKRLRKTSQTSNCLVFSERLNINFFQHKCGIWVSSVHIVWTQPKCFISKGLTGPTKLTKFFHFIIHPTPFRMRSTFPHPFQLSASPTPSWWVTKGVNFPKSDVGKFPPSIIYLGGNLSTLKIYFSLCLNVFCWK